MIAIGIDYGSTNSLVATFVPKIEGNIPITHLKSAVTYNCEYILSPKRMLHNIDAISQEDINKICRCIELCVNMLLTTHIEGHESDYNQVSMAITVPNAFKDRECRILKSIVESNIRGILKAKGIDSSIEVSIIPEPIAAALYFAYAMDRIGCLHNEQHIVVSDVGGGTTDLAIVRATSYKGQFEFEVLNTEHMFELGGNDIDNNIADYLIAKRPELQNIDRDTLVRACCELKRGFSRYKGQSHSQQAVLDDSGEFLMVNGNPVILEMSIDELGTVLSQNDNFLSKYKTLVSRLKDNFSTSSSSDVYLLPIGGTSRLVLVRDALKEVFFEYRDREVALRTEDDNIDRYDSVVRGAAIYAAYKGQLIDGNVVIKNRTMHRISLLFGSNKLHECVGECFIDGDYTHECKCEPTYLDEGSGTFKIGGVRFYQGGRSINVDDDCEVLCDITVDDTLYTHGRQLKDIVVKVTLAIHQGRLRSVTFCAEGCGANGEDYIKRFDCNI